MSARATRAGLRARAPRRPWAGRLRATAILLGIALSVGVAGAQGPTPVPEASSGPSATTVTQVPAVAAFGDDVRATPYLGAVASYGSLYRDLSYRTDVRRVEIDGARATTVAAYEGSVVEILTGRQITAAGDAEVAFRWDGCRWIRTGLRY